MVIIQSDSFLNCHSFQKALASTGLSRSQFADMKFFENRTNGQSKGYALLVLNSDAAVKQVMETLPSKPIHGQSCTVLAYNKTNQAKLEEAQAKNQTRPDVKKKVSIKQLVACGLHYISGLCPIGPVACRSAVGCVVVCRPTSRGFIPHAPLKLSGVLSVWSWAGSRCKSVSESYRRPPSKGCALKVHPNNFIFALTPYLCYS